ncbi:MAG: peptidoglycan DD-metalloendopeptidase family protein [Candidatus Thiodiazotropha sp. DIVDIV]
MQSRYGLIGLISPVPVLMFSLLIGLIGCSSSGSAPVYSRGVNSHPQDRPVASVSKKQSMPVRRKSSLTYYLVQPGDTLYSISWRHYLEHQQLASWNGIKAPKYSIYPGQRLRLKPPETRRPRQQKQAVTKPVVKVVRKSDKPVAPSKRKSPEKSQKKITKTKATPAKSNSVSQRKKNIKLAWSWPTKGRVVQTFSNSDQNRKGVRISGRQGQSIKASEAGRVVYAGGGLVGYGNLVIIKHDQNYLSAYGYNRKLLVKEGDNIAKGDIVAHMGSPNSGGQPVLHFEIRKQGKPINPLPLLPRK